MFGFDFDDLFVLNLVKLKDSLKCRFLLRFVRYQCFRGFRVGLRVRSDVGVLVGSVISFDV